MFEYLPDIAYFDNDSELADETPISETVDTELALESALGANVLMVGNRPARVTAVVDEIEPVPVTREIVREVVDPLPIIEEVIVVDDPFEAFLEPEFVEPVVVTEVVEIAVSDEIKDVLSDFEAFDSSYELTTTRVALTNDHVVSAGFTGAFLEPENFDGFLYKTISVGDLYGLKVEKFLVTNGVKQYAKVYVVTPEDLASTPEIYSVLKVRASEGLEVEVNEVNDFGDKSFYMNDLRRQHVAFLTVKIGTTIYGFAYPKDYHPQIVNMLTLIGG